MHIRYRSWLRFGVSLFVIGAALAAVGFSARSQGSVASITRVSVSSAGVQGNSYSYHYLGPSISPDGRYVAFMSDASNLIPGDTNNQSDVFVHDRQTRQTVRISVSSAGVQGNNSSNAPAIIR